MTVASHSATQLDGRLDREQRGALRRMFNLADQLPDDWSGMMARSTLQEDFGALRFQLAYMAYAMGLAHVHRLPAAPALFREAIARLIEKLRSPDVWTYWHYVSTGNGALNQSLGELPAEWNPVVRDNIMYSAYLQSTALLFHHLFDDGRYATAGALTLNLRPLFWGSAPKEFVYDERSLSDHIYWQMVQNGYLGVACEPNCIFQICNQVPILGFRLQDLVYGGSRAEEVTAGYREAWAQFGILNDNGHFNMMVQEHERAVLTPEAPWADFWAGALMNAWNPELVQAAYPAQADRWMLPGPDGTAWVDQAESAFTRAGLPSSLDFGWAAVCASEVGDSRRLGQLLDYADARLNPCWERGGLFYPRHDIVHDTDGFLTAVDPHTGNALLGYAQLNVPDGLRWLYEGGWTAERKADPAIHEITGRLDFEEARFDRHAARLDWTVLPVDDRAVQAGFGIGHELGDRDWDLRIDGVQVATNDVAGPIRAHVSDGWIRIELEIHRRTELALSWR